MAAIPDFLVRTPIDVPNRSGFDMSFETHFTGQCGTLMPALVKEIFPNETISLGMLFDAELPPMVSNFFGKVDMVFEAFFVPNRLLWGGWEYFAVHPTDNPLYPEGTPVAAKPHAIPQFTFSMDNKDVTKRGSLADMLGVKVGFNPDFTSSRSVSSLPFLAYHRIYDDHYRNTLVQCPVFSKPSGYLVENYGDFSPLSAAPFDTLVNSDLEEDLNNVRNFTPDDLFVDGVHLYELRQRNWDIDYFSSATPKPQAGGPATVEFSVDENSQGEISISSIREANALQKWLERNNIAGYDYADQTYAQYGCYPDARSLTKSLYLGRHSEVVYNRSVFQQSPATSADTGSRNPFDSVGTKFGASQSTGDGSLFNNFKATDHGYLVVMCSMRPRAYYSTGVDRKLLRKYIGDVPFPLLSSVGDQAILNCELSGFSVLNHDKTPFGYTDRFAEVKCSLDEVHGELVDDGRLDAFVLQRSFDPAFLNTIGTDFLQIPTNFMDQVRQAQTSFIPVDYWIDIYFAFKKVSPFPVYSVPTLGDLKNVHVETMKRGGSQL